MTIMMKTANRLSLVGLLTLSFFAPLFAFAHESHEYEINGVPYEIVIGSRGEPVIVDDKTGIDLEIVRDGEVFVGAQDTLQVELIAGDKRRVDAIEPVYGSEGKYKNNFIATVATTLQYRIFGTLEGIPFDVTYACNPVGHPRSEEVTTRTDISEGVVETHRSGAFGCPQEKEAFGFPESAPSGVALAANMADTEVSEALPETIAVQYELHWLVFLSVMLAFLAIMISIYGFTRKG